MVYNKQAACKPCYRPLILYWMLELADMGEISDVAAQAVVCRQHRMGEAQTSVHAQAFHQALRGQVGVAGVGGECRQVQVV